MKRIFTLIVATCATFSISTLSYAENKWGLHGEGTENSPYLISSADDFTKIANNISADNTGLGEYFQMTNDIDFGGSASNPAQLPAIGKAAISNISTVAYGFEGVFNGNSHTIKGIYHTNNANDANGKFNALFSSLGEHGVITAVCIDKDNYINSYNYCATIASISKGSITYCENNANIIASNAFAAGICGYMIGGKGTIDKCVNNGNITAMTYASGIVSGSQSGAAITTYNYLVSNCSNYGTIASTNATTSGCAGIAGSYSGAITDCTNYGTIEGLNKQYAAGILACGSYAVSVSNCTNEGEITCGKNSGGIVGHLLKGDDKDVTISSCTNNGSVTASASATNVAGIIGNHAHTAASTITIVDCKNNGLVSGGNAASMGNLRGNASIVIDGDWYISPALSRLALDPEYDAVETIEETAATADAPRYSISGMTVGYNHNGIVIVNGKKFIK